jgi:hypothetical protein
MADMHTHVAAANTLANPNVISSSELICRGLFVVVVLAHAMRFYYSTWQRVSHAAMV